MRSLQELSGAPAKQDFAELNLHLLACRSLGAGRGIFEQPEKAAFPPTYGIYQNIT
jgi:hypothetical protein